MNTIEYLNALRERLNLRSDYALAKALGASQQSVSRYRQGKNSFDDATALRVAELLDMDAGTVLADVYAERAKDPAVASVWRRMAQLMSRHGTAAALALVVVGGALLASPTPAVEAGASNPTNLSMYIMSSAAAWWWLFHNPFFLRPFRRRLLHFVA